MRAPICEVCLRSELLCAACVDKLSKSKITQLDVDISRALYELSSKIKSLQNVKLLRTMDVGTSSGQSMLLLIAERGDGARLVGRGGSVVKDLARKFGKNIRVLEFSEMRSFVRQLLAPAAVLGINTVYRIDGESYRIKVPKEHKRRILVNSAAVSGIIKEFFGKDAELVFES